MTTHHPRRRHDSVRRACDRCQSRLCACLLVLLVLALATVPFLAGEAAYAAESRVAARQSAARHRVTAHAVTDAQGVSAASGVRWAPVRWTDGRGGSHTGFTEVPGDIVEGGAVEVWVDGSGRLVKPPTTRQEALSTGWFTGAMAAVAVLLVHLGARTALIAAIDRRRYEQWAAEWRVVEPLWSKRLPT
ncbi:hypothetical protein J7W19_00565 [Streptomyces mobaraensis NBRC 13819 = DSM 40847]|uniref:Integral membrane protein n=1 Tax=Streptomyces mobaraensis (strain ATCC 29032 / DSM 40847 / JCM 4168 / NBRC 13819 / NCIMB 11159 / IPCR 16-22) TaxID=1223523 RepID=M3B687_STRM1|nr:hypothetical protein [Streptomyces mobaraensis]EMF01498.1 hypothetical protein H340_05661 [Streptomyces mobaraensis NBRC 13819 = DSM 40847]QTT72125.1 hypothetical protein J7W19_00565 [Streptomyces mobaraensis NBRC 13819 = DSM 40847]